MKGMYKELINSAISALKNAYCPYSKFRVGAAVLTKKGAVYTGSNVENASYGLTVCAERVAICKAVSEGEKDMVALAIASDSSDYAFPCGACRQVISEFNADMKILLLNKKGGVRIVHSSELMPLPFSGKQVRKK